MPSGDVGPILLPYTHKSEIYHREGKMEYGGTPSPPLLMIVAMFVVLDHMRPGCSVLMALVFVMLAINKEWVDRWPLSPPSKVRFRSVDGEITVSSATWSNLDHGGDQWHRRTGRRRLIGGYICSYGAEHRRRKPSGGAAGGRIRSS